MIAGFNGFFFSIIFFPSFFSHHHHDFVFEKSNTPVCGSNNPTPTAPTSQLRSEI
jgi:hypothetical protein